MRQLDESETVAARKDIVFGNQTKVLVNDPAFIEAVRRLEKQYIDEWRTSAVPAVQATAWAKLRALDDFANEFRAMIGSGEMASRTLAKLER